MRNSAAGLIIVLTAPLVCGQTFDVASLKPGDSNLVPGVSRQMKGGPGTADPGRVTFTQVTLSQLIMRAWDVQHFQIAGPAWHGDPTPIYGYTINATMPPDTTKEKFRVMLRNLLIDRFQMRIHREKKTMNGYELVIAPGGPKLKETTQDPDAPPGHVQSGVTADGFPLLPPGHAAGVAVSGGAEHLKAQSYTLEDLPGSYLPGFVSAATGDPVGPIVDKTGLTSKYDFTLVFDARRGAPPLVSPNIPLPPEPEEGSGYPGLFGAIEKQLGLRLVKVKDVPVDMLIIDGMERSPIKN
jgi:uncharacterized protein (TIGR03435 family)